MLIDGIKSKPVYRPLAADPTGVHHILAGHGEGAEALLQVANTLAGSAGPIEIHYAGDAGHAARLLALPGDTVTIHGSAADVARQLDVALSRARMGTRLYLAGDEHFLWETTRLAGRHGMAHSDIQREWTGGAGRRVYCVHCGNIADGITINVTPCPACGVHLLVRDHFSRFHNAYMGVCADAEAPGQLPAVEELA